MSCAPWAGDIKSPGPIGPSRCEGRGDAIRIADGRGVELAFSGPDSAQQEEWGRSYEGWAAEGRRWI